MATSSIGFSPTSLVAPDLQTQLLANQRRQQLAQMLREQSIQPEQTQEVSGRVVPYGIGQGMTKLAQALMARRAQSSADQQMSDLNQQYAARYAAALSRTIPGAQGNVLSPGQLNADGTNPGTVGPTVQNAAQIDTGSSNLADAARAAAMMGNTDLADKLTMQAWQQLAPTDAMKNFNAPGEFGDITRNTDRANSAKAPLMDVRQGNTLYNVMAGRPDYTAPDISMGANVTYDANGNPVMSQIPGYGGVIANKAAAETRGSLAGQSLPSGGQPSNKLPWHDMPVLSAPAGMGATTYGKQMQEGAAATAKALTEKYGGLANDAQQRLAINNQILDLVDKADTGPMAASQANVKSYLQKFGIPEGDFANSPSATIALQKDLLNAATGRAKQMYGSRMTQSEVMLMLSKGAPNVDMPKAAIKFLVGTDNQALDHQLKQAQDLGTYLQSGGDPYQFEGWYSKKFPTTITTHLGDSQGSPQGSSRKVIRTGSYNGRKVNQYDDGSIEPVD